MQVSLFLPSQNQIQIHFERAYAQTAWCYVNAGNMLSLQTICVRDVTDLVKMAATATMLAQCLEVDFEQTRQ